MSARKTPILLRKAPLSGGINVLTNYRRVGKVIRSATDGKHDVTADFDALVLEELLNPDATGITAALDGAARGMTLDASERKEVRVFRNRLVALIERHNRTGHGSEGRGVR